MRKEDLADWILNRLAELTELVEPFLEIDSQVTCDAGAWTPLKLFALRYYMNIYTPIVSNHFDNMYYIDLLAGSGLCKVGENRFVVGSPVVAATLTKKPFKKLLMAEIDPQSRDALRRRLESIEPRPEFEMYSDCNDCAPQLLAHIDKRSTHFLAFADCAKDDVSWQTVESLLRRNGDLIINYPTSIIRRMAGSARQGGTDPGRLHRFFGSSDWMQYEPSRLLDFYEKRIQGFRDLVESIRVTSRLKEGSFHYHLIFAARKTSGGSHWFNAVQDLKHVIERCSGEQLKRLTEVLTGKTKDLTGFTKKTGYPTLADWQRKS